MPTNATLTSFHTFSALTKAKPPEVNRNFSNYRGHLLPIDPNTAAAATSGVYDLGSSDNLWRAIYLSEGLRATYGSNHFTATVADVDGVTDRNTQFLDQTSTPVQMIVTTNGNPIRLGIRAASSYASAPSLWIMGVFGQADCRIYFVRDTTTLTLQKIGTYSPTGTGQNIRIWYPITDIQDRDTPPAGTYTYKLYGKIIAPHTGSSEIELYNFRLYAEEEYW